MKCITSCLLLAASSLLTAQHGPAPTANTLIQGAHLPDFVAVKAVKGYLMPYGVLHPCAAKAPAQADMADAQKLSLYLDIQNIGAAPWPHEWRKCEHEGCNYQLLYVKVPSVLFTREYLDEPTAPLFHEHGYRELRFDGATPATVQKYVAPNVVHRISLGAWNSAWPTRLAFHLNRENLLGEETSLHDLEAARQNNKVVLTVQ